MQATEGPILITGAGGGVGTHLAEVLLRDGARNLVFHVRGRSDALREILAKHRIDAERALVQAELTDEAQVRRMHDAVSERFGPLYGLVNLAGASSNAMSWKLSTEEFRNIVDANLLTTFLCSREFIPEMREQERGRIVNVASVTGVAGAVGCAHYCAAKAAVIGLTKALAQELTPKRIAVSAIALGYFEFGLIESIPEKQREAIRTSIPAQRFGTAEELAGLVSWLLGPAGAYAGGQIYHLNGGMVG